jgi:hypothetical protein
MAANLGLRYEVRGMVAGQAPMGVACVEGVSVGDEWCGVGRSLVCGLGLLGGGRCGECSGVRLGGVSDP